MTVAALQAEALDRALAGGRPFDPHGHLQTVMRTSAGAWSLAAGADLSFPQVGRAGASQRVLGRYVDRVQSGAERDPRVGRAFLRVISLVDPPAALFRPAVLAAAARG